jgi:hypothetical protein
LADKIAQCLGAQKIGQRAVDEVLLIGVGEKIHGLV